MAGIGCGVDVFAVALLECGTCKSLSTNWQLQILPVAIIAGTPYLHCPICGCEVGEELQATPEFRKKWDMAYKKLVEEKFVRVQF